MIQINKYVIICNIVYFILINTNLKSFDFIYVCVYVVLDVYSVTEIILNVRSYVIGNKKIHIEALFFFFISLATGVQFIKYCSDT